jgi:hypothetical protein
VTVTVEVTVDRRPLGDGEEWRQLRRSWERKLGLRFGAVDVDGPNIRRGAPASLPDHLPDSAWAAHRQKTAGRASGLEARHWQR